MLSQKSDLTWAILDEENAADATEFSATPQLPTEHAPSRVRPHELLLTTLLLVSIGYIAWQESKGSRLNVSIEEPASATVQQDAAMAAEGQTADRLVMVEVEIDPTALNALPTAYRSHRFYRQTADGWQASTPGIEYWGELQTLETDYFYLEFYERDRSVIERVAVDLDALWQTLHRQLGLAQPSSKETLAIQVLPNSSHHRRALNPFKVPSALPVSSPILLPIPSSLTETGLLRSDIAQHLATLALFRKIGPSSPEVWRGAPGVQGLLRWLITQESVEPAAASYYHMVLRAWQQQITENPTPHLSNITSTYLLSQQHNDFWVEMELVRQTMIVESAIDYALTTHGQKHLPALIEAIRREEAWTEIVPEVFGVSVETFEHGWHESLGPN